eukprot:scaffold1895_cov123-Isochrysis_galbana.AAC.6
MPAIRDNQTAAHLFWSLVWTTRGVGAWEELGCCDCGWLTLEDGSCRVSEFPLPSPPPMRKKKEYPRPVEGDDGAPTVPPGADRGRHGLGQGLETSPSRQHERGLNSGTIARPSDCLWHRLALHITLLALA